MSLLHTPKEISLSLLANKAASFSPAQYKQITIANPNTHTIKDLLQGQKPISGVEVGSNSTVSFKTPYKFLRTKAFSSDYFSPSIASRDSFSYIKPSSFEKYKGIGGRRVIGEGDILFISGGSVGEVGVASRALADTIPSSHILKLPFPKNKYYIFAFLKHQLGKEQANFGPLGSIGGLDSFTIDTLLNIRIPFPSRSNGNELIESIEKLVASILAQENFIKEKNESIFHLIDEEINTNQSNTRGSFTYRYPTYEELKQKVRLDTGLYKPDYQKQRSIISGYKDGAKTLKALGYIISRGQNLQISNIGRSHYSSTYSKGMYKLVLSKDFTDWMTYYKAGYIGNTRNLKEIKQGDIIFSCRGDLGRLFLCLEDEKKLITNIDNMHISNPAATETDTIFVAAFLNYLRRKGYLESIAISGSGASSFTKYHFDLLEIPIFPPSIKKRIATIFHNAPAKTQKELGIYEISKSLSNLKQELDNKLNQIISGSNRLPSKN